MKNPQRINLNTADAKLMASLLHGIGQGLAEDIVKLHDNIAETQGRDIELEDLTQIPPNRIPLAIWKDNFVHNYICFDDTMNPPSRKEVCEAFPAMFSAEEMAAYEAAVLGNLGVIKSHLDTEMNKLQTEQSEQNTKIESVQVAVSQQIEDTQQALKSEISTVNTDLLSEISRVNRSTESLMDSIRAMRDQLTRSSKSMQETVDSVLAKVEEHDKALQQKLSSSPSRTQTSNTAVPPATVVPPIVHPQYGIPAPVPPNHLYNPNAYFNPVVPPVPFVRPPPMVIGPPPYHPPTVHSSPINPSPTLPSTNHTSSDSSYHSLSRDVPPLSSPLHDSNKTSLKEVVGATKSSSLHITGPPDHRKPLHARNDGNGDNSDDDNDICRGQLPDTQIPSAYAVPQHMNCFQGNKYSQTLFSVGSKIDQICHNSCKTNAAGLLERVKSLKQSMTATLISMKERSEAFDGKVDVILNKVEGNQRMLQIKFPWLQAAMSSIDVPSIQSIHHVTSECVRLKNDSHLMTIPDMNSSPMRVPTNPHSDPIKHMNSNPKVFPTAAHLNPHSSSSCDMSSSSPASHPHFPHTMSATTKSYISSSCKSFPCERQMSDTSDEFPCNIKFPSVTKYKDQECFPQFPTTDGNVYSISIAPCVKCNQPTQGSSHQQHSNIYVNSSLAGCVACEYECNTNEQLFSIEDIDDSNLHSGNIPELEYLKSLSRPIMSPHQSCMRSSVPKYILCIPRKRRKRFKIPNVSKRNYQYHSIHQYHHHDATPALDSRLYDRGRSYNKGQSYDRGWKCILLRFVLHSPKTWSVFPKDLFCIHPINPFNILAHML